MGGLFRSSRKSEAATTILMVLIAVFFIGWIFNINQRECRTNKDCGSESYCGSDFACHQYPTIQKTIVQYNLLAPSIIIAIAIIIVALIFNWGRLKAGEEPRQMEEVTQAEAPEAYEISEPYYKSNGDVKTP